MQKTPLFEKHQALGATFTDFGGWNMPVRYGSDLDEHHAVRNSAGLFDISHMSEFTVRGQAAQYLDYAVVSMVSKLEAGRAKYTMICSEDGGVIDDLIVCRISEEEFLIIANAANRAQVFRALSERAKGFEVELEDVSDAFSLIAIQGPKAQAILQQLVDGDLAPLKYYSITQMRLSGISVQIARTGYTGEDGFEILLSNQAAEEVWDLLVASGGQDLVTCGLASRDTLRLEAGMPLYGHELDLQTTPFEAGLGKIISFDKSFVGSEALGALKDKVPAKRLYGLRGEGKRAARADYEIFLPETSVAIGKVTSGVLSPSLGHPIALAYLNGNLELEVGSKLEADVRGSRVGYEVVALPFYKRGR